MYVNTLLKKKEKNKIAIISDTCTKVDLLKGLPDNLFVGENNNQLRNSDLKNIILSHQK